jgi:hypothetical protein
MLFYERQIPPENFYNNAIRYGEARNRLINIMGDAFIDMYDYEFWVVSLFESENAESEIDKIITSPLKNIYRRDLIRNLITKSLVIAYSKSNATCRFETEYDPERNTVPYEISEKIRVFEGDKSIIILPKTDGKYVQKAVINCIITKPKDRFSDLIE